MSPTGDLPTMSASNYANNTYSGAQMMGGAFAGTQQAMAMAEVWKPEDNEELRVLQQLLQVTEPRQAALRATTTHHKEKPMPARRIVQVYIADPSEAVPLEQAILYTGKQQMTDLTDQELFFEIDIRDLLAEHNEKRTKIIDKKVKDRTEYLEPVKVRDLKMVVVTVASF
jgi:hypothetical protein